MDKRWFKASGWLWLSLLVPLYFGLVSLAYSVSQPYLIQDDARLHLVWLQQWVDPDLFPNDPIAHYYQTIQAAGFQAVYGMFAQVGIAPLLLAKLLPLLLAMVTTIYLFYLTQFLLPHPACGFLTTLLLNQNIWIKDDLISATPRAFVYPLFAAFLYYLLRRSSLPTLISLGLMGLFYPQMALVELGILTLRLWTGRSARRGNYALLLTGLAVALLVILPFQQQVSREFGALQSAAQMQQMPEFGPFGRRAYFGVPPLQFWFAGASGLRFPLFPPILWVGLALPLLLRTQLPAVQRITSEVRLLAEIGLSAIGWFLLAHLLLPRLYLPSRYTFYSLRVLIALAAGIVLFVAIETWVLPLFRSTAPRRLRQSGLRVVVVALLLAVAIVPAIPPVFLDGQGWIMGQQPAVYQFLAAQPKSTLIGSLSREADNLPAFSQRSVFVSRELALAYHPLFYQLMQQRISNLLEIYYSSDLNTVQTLLQQTHLDYLVIDRQFANPDYLLQQDWLIHSSLQSTVQQFADALQQGTRPALTQVIDRCTVLAEKDLIILDTRCMGL
jgi:hypothetical protein